MTNDLPLNEIVNSDSTGSRIVSMAQRGPSLFVARNDSPIQDVREIVPEQVQEEKARLASRYYVDELLDIKSEVRTLKEEIGGTKQRKALLEEAAAQLRFARDNTSSERRLTHLIGSRAYLRKAWMSLSIKDGYLGQGILIAYYALCNTKPEEVTSEQAGLLAELLTALRLKEVSSELVRAHRRILIGAGLRLTGNREGFTFE